MTLSVHARAVLEKVDPRKTDKWDTKILFETAREVRLKEVNQLALEDVKEILAYLDREGR